MLKDIYINNEIVLQAGDDRYFVNLWYPRSSDRPKIQIELVDIRSNEIVLQAGDDRYFVSLWYPRSSDRPKIQIELVDIRSADGIQVEYDFGRDGWSILQGSEKLDNWVEVAFIKAWARDEEENEDI